MKDFILEGCVDSVESAVAAEKGGANRLELCGNLIIGGTTPDINMFLTVRQKVSIKIHVIIRPRFGDFYFTDDEFDIMEKDIEMFRDNGADGVVIGALTLDGRLDIERMKRLVAAAGDMSITLHRAFDVCRNPFEAMQDAIDLGIDSILTSGQKDKCLDGKDLLKELVEKADGKIDILIGSGISSDTIEEVATFTKAKSYHLTGSVKLDSPMIYRNEGVSMGLPILSEFTLFRTDENEIAKVKEILLRV